MTLPSATPYEHPQDQLLAALDLDPVRGELHPTQVRQEIERAEAAIREAYAGRNDVVVQTIIELVHLEHEHHGHVKEARAAALAALTRATQEVRALSNAVTRLGERDLFDVEVEGKETTFTNALAQVEVGLAAVRGLLPAVDA